MNQDLRAISDGKLYELNDMVRVGCHDCAGCSTCCQGMGDSVLLDPFDVHRLMTGLGMSFQELLQDYIELHLEEGLILPNLKMTAWNRKLLQAKRRGEATVLKTPKVDDTACVFLNLEGRCSIHSFRPGICRLFPLGRNYETDQAGVMTMNYFLLTKECPVTNKSKVKVSKWLDTPQIRDYQNFLIRWHALTKRMREEVSANPGEEARSQTSALFLRFFYEKPYEDGDFFREFESRARLME